MAGQLDEDDELGVMLLPARLGHIPLPPGQDSEL
jgi:hypothetical protein